MPGAREASGAPGRIWLRRVAWLLAFWIAGVAALGLLAWGLKSVMRLAGLAA